MRPFAYARPTDPAEAVDLVTSTDGATYLAGGTNLVDLMKLGAARPTMRVDVGGLGFDAVDELDGGGLRIGRGLGFGCRWRRNGPTRPLNDTTRIVRRTPRPLAQAARRARGHVAVAAPRRTTRYFSGRG
jgi:hypothetical protein